MSDAEKLKYINEHPERIRPFLENPLHCDDVAVSRIKFAHHRIRTIWIGLMVELENVNDSIWFIYNHQRGTDLIISFARGELEEHVRFYLDVFVAQPSQSCYCFVDYKDATGSHTRGLKDYASLIVFLRKWLETTRNKFDAWSAPDTTTPEIVEERKIIRSHSFSGFFRRSSPRVTKKLRRTGSGK